ncbi:MAG: terminase family protein, partial [Halieaceae bacterium]|nr:terminase family protein [Halieaceae bacterium]
MGIAQRFDLPPAWEPQPGPQSYLLACPIEDVFFGGARGGGKSDALIGDWLNHWYTYGKAANGIIFRRTLTEMEEIEARMLEVYPAVGAVYRSGKKTWVFPGGARLKLRYLERDADASRYQGHGYTWVGVDEAGNFPSPDPIDKLRAAMRTGGGVPCVMRLTGNPGGVGHNWLKARYIDPATPMVPHACRETGIRRVFIPSKLSDNAKLSDPDAYVRRLR